MYCKVASYAMAALSTSPSVSAREAMESQVSAVDWARWSIWEAVCSVPFAAAGATAPAAVVAVPLVVATAFAFAGEPASPITVPCCPFISPVAPWGLCSFAAVVMVLCIVVVGKCGI